MKNILIGGYYGAGNLGDEAILECMLKDFRAQRDDLAFFVTSWNPTQTRKQYKVESFHWQDIPALLEAGQQANLIILGGGGLFQDYWGLEKDYYLRSGFRDISAYGSLPLLAQLLGTPCMIYAVGLGPFKSKEALLHTRFAFENCQASTLRDPESLILLKSSGYPDKKSIPIPKVLADPVFTLATDNRDTFQANTLLNKYKIDARSNLITVSLRYWSQADSKLNWLEKIAYGLNKFLEVNDTFQVILLTFQNNDLSEFTNDGSINNEFKQFDIQNRYHLITDQITPRMAQALIQKSSLLLGMRLHSLIMGINANTPIVGISYDPKVASLMKSAGLSQYCCTPFPPESTDIEAKLQQAWINQGQISVKLKKFHELSFRAAQVNTRIALELLPKKKTESRIFAKQFPINQITLINELDGILEDASKKNSELLTQIEKIKKDFSIKSTEFNLQRSSLEGELKRISQEKWAIARKLDREIDENKSAQIQIKMVEGKLEERNTELEVMRSSLNKIYSSKIWKLASIYYSKVNKLKSYFSTNFSTKDDRIRNPISVENNLTTIVKQLNSKELKGIFVVTSTLPFDEFYNQRVINLAKYLSQNGYGVIFVAWRWTREEIISGEKLEVFKNIYQIPFDLFLPDILKLYEINHTKKYFIVEFPHPDLYLAALKLRKLNFIVVYEIIDDWEYFNQEGQAIWFNSEIENSMVLNANLITAVSKPLQEKFSDIRNDIKLIPNGYDPKLLGVKNSYIARNKFSMNDINIGYFGHLTPSWFDWDFLYSLLEQSEIKGLNIQFHIIGYGEPDLKKFEKFAGKFFFYGRVIPSQLYKHVKFWDLAMIPFKPGKLAESVDPIKLYEYLFFGLPTIVRGISHLENHPFAMLVSSPSEFFDAIKQMGTLAQYNQINPELDKVISESTWDNRFSNLIKEVDKDLWMFL